MVISDNNSINMNKNIIILYNINNKSLPEIKFLLFLKFYN
jgi:hypothetical protein